MSKLSSDKDVGIAPNPFKTFLTKILGGASPDPTKDSAPDRPPMFTVFLHNNPYTPAETVTRVLRQAFDLTSEQADTLMFQVHQSGPNAKEAIATYPRDVAEAKIALAKQIEAEDIRRMMRETNWPCALELSLASSED